MQEKTLLDIGGGVGAVQHELLKAGIASAVGVEASTAYINVVEDEAQRQGHADRISSRHGNFVEIAEDVQEANIVTLDRVICCYHDLESLVDLSSRRATELYGIVYPRETPLVRFAFAFINVLMRLRRNPFRLFVHPTATIDRLLGSNGFQRRYYSKTPIWQVAVYER